MVRPGTAAPSWDNSRTVLGRFLGTGLAALWLSNQPAPLLRPRTDKLVRPSAAPWGAGPLYGRLIGASQSGRKPWAGQARHLSTRDQGCRAALRGTALQQNCCFLSHLGEA